MSDESPSPLYVEDHWLTVQYRWKGRLSALGNFIKSVGFDVERAGYAVVGVTIPSGSELRPENAVLDNYDPSKNWESNIEFRIGEKS